MNSCSSTRLICSQLSLGLDLKIGVERECVRCAILINLLSLSLFLRLHKHKGWLKSVFTNPNFQVHGCLQIKIMLLNKNYRPPTNQNKSGIQFFKTKRDKAYLADYQTIACKSTRYKPRRGCSNSTQSQSAQSSDYNERL